MTSEPPPDHAFEPRPGDVQPGPAPTSGPGPAPPGPSRSARDPRRVAWMVALAADFIQWIALPAFIGGAASPWNDALDVFVAVVMIRVLGWHWSFLPTFIAEDCIACEQCVAVCPGLAVTLACEYTLRRNSSIG